MTEAIASAFAMPVTQSGWTFIARGDGAVIIVSLSGEYVEMTAKQWHRVAASLQPASRLMDGAGLTESAHVRFWSKVALPDANGCMLWAAGLDRGGYGQFNRGDRTLKAHQVAWWFANGPLPRGLVLDHLCQVRACVHRATWRPSRRPRMRAELGPEQRRAGAATVGTSRNRSSARTAVSAVSVATRASDSATNRQDGDETHHWRLGALRVVRHPRR